MDITDNLTSKAFPEVPHKWSLANDAKLSNLLQRLSEKLTLMTHDVQTGLEKLENKLDDIGIAVCNTNNDLFVLSHKQFMENRTYIADKNTRPVHPSTTGVSMTMKNETGIFTACKSALMFGISLSKSSIANEDENDNTYTSRVLPPIIGSDDFLLHSNYCTSGAKRVKESYSQQPVYSSPSTPVLRGTVTMPTPISLTTVSDKSSNSSLCPDPNSILVNHHSNVDLDKDFKKDNIPKSNDENQPLLKGIPVLPVPPDNLSNNVEVYNEIKDGTMSRAELERSTLHSKGGDSNKKSDLFDSDSDGMFESELLRNSRALKNSNSMKGIVSEEQHLPAKKVPTGGISIFPSSLTNSVIKKTGYKPPVKPKPPTAKTSKEPPVIKSDLNRANANKVNRQDSSDYSYSDLFSPVVEKAIVPISKAKDPVLNSSFEEEEEYTHSVKKRFSKTVQSHAITTKQNPVLPSKEKSIFSSDSDSDPFSCSPKTTRPLIRKSPEIVNRMITSDKYSPVLSEKISTPVNNTQQKKSAHMNSIIQDNCDIFSDSISEISKQVQAPVFSKHDIRIPGKAPASDKSEDEDIFQNNKNTSTSSENSLGAKSQYSTPHDSQVPALPSIPLSSYDIFDDLTSCNIPSPPPFDQVVDPVYTLSHQFLESPKLVRHSGSFFRDSPPPLSDATVDTTSSTNSSDKNVWTNFPESSQGLSSTTRKLTGSEASLESNTSSKYETVLEKHTKSTFKHTNKMNSLISSLESRLSIRPPSDTVPKSPVLPGSQPSPDLTSQHGDTTHETPSFVIPPQHTLLVNLQKGRPKIQQKRRHPSKNRYKVKENLINSNESSTSGPELEPPQSTALTNEVILKKEKHIKITPVISDSDKTPILADLSTDQRSINLNSIGIHSSTDAISSTSSDKLENEDLLTTGSKNNIDKSLKIVPPINTIEETKNRKTVSSSINIRQMEDILANKFDNSLPKNAGLSSYLKTNSKKANLFGTDSSDEDGIYSNKYDTSKPEVTSINNNTDTRIRGEDSKTVITNSKIPNITNDIKFAVPRLTLKDNLTAEEKEKLLSDSNYVDREITASKIQEGKIDTKSISKSIGSIAKSKKNNSKSDNFFDNSSSDDDNLFSVKPGKPKRKKVASGTDQQSDRLGKTRSIAGVTSDSGKTAIGAVEKSLDSSLLFHATGKQINEQKSVTEEVPKTSTPKLNIKVSNSISKDIDKQGKLKNTNLFDSHSSDDSDIFSSAPSNANNGKMSERNSNRSSEPTRTAYKNINSSVINPLLSVEDSKSTKINKNITRNTSQDALHTNSSENENCQNPIKVLDMTSTPKNVSNALSETAILTSVKTKQKSIDIFDSELSDEDGIFSKSRLTIRQKDTVKVNKHVNHSEQPISNNTEELPQAQRNLPASSVNSCAAGPKHNKTYSVGKLPQQNISSKRTKIKGLFNSSDESDDISSKKSNQLKQPSSRLKCPVKKSSLFSDSSDDSDSLFAPTTKRVYTISRKTHLPSKTMTKDSTSVVKADVGKKADKPSKNIFLSDSDDDRLFSHNKQNSNKKVHS